jgi:hypothetical protein
MRWECIEVDSPAGVAYQNVCATRFPRVKKTTPADQHIVVWERDRVMGGVSLWHSKLSQDHDVINFWNATTELTGIRMSRLWVDGARKTEVIRELFSGVLASTPEDAFLYGLLALSLAEARSLKLDVSLDLLQPKISLTECQWPEDLKPTSDGKPLVKMYESRGVGAIGAMSGDPQGHTIRLAMGAFKKNLKGRGHAP